MIRATEVIARGDWRGDPADTVVLDFDDRHRRRFAMEGVGGLNFLLDLHEAVALRTGDALKLEDGRMVEVVGASEPLAEIRAESPEHLLRLAWHLGNRHLPVQVAGQKLRIRRDHVIEAMVQGLGGQVRAIEAAFDPEGGAYAQATHAHHHGHDHHDHDHNHGHRHDDRHHDDRGHHAHKHDPAHHEHGADCGCGHHHHGHKHG
ncbi:MAG: urease accessory protein UreE [Methylobacterium sp.]|nr:urease accessory protein UreE [Methylobacterium sp.]MCA3604720.1 urease accessory protein UreE [Methylobacterium sp.]MCA3616440.1 urease accessory protein UreE [Methylobacterium sp.]